MTTVQSGTSSPAAVRFNYTPSPYRCVSPNPEPHQWPAVPVPTNHGTPHSNCRRNNGRDKFGPCVCTAEPPMRLIHNHGLCDQLVNMSVTFTSRPNTIIFESRRFLQAKHADIQGWIHRSPKLCEVPRYTVSSRSMQLGSLAQTCTSQIS